MTHGHVVGGGQVTTGQQLSQGGGTGQVSHTPVFSENWMKRFDIFKTLTFADRRFVTPCHIAVAIQDWSTN